MNDDTNQRAREYLLVKRGLYYRPDNQGYTGIRDLAGRYFESDASPEDGVTAVHHEEAPLFSAACFDDLKVKHLLGKIAEAEERATSARDEALRETAEKLRLEADAMHRDLKLGDAFASGCIHGIRLSRVSLLSLITGGGGTPTPTPAETEAAFLVALAEHGVPADVAELLVQGNPRLGCPPGALRAALGAIGRTAA